DLTHDISRQLNLPEKMRGVVVANVESGSLAETRLMRGDVILEVNRKAVANIEDYQSAVSAISRESDVLLLVFRRGSTIFVTISGKE
ncbi:MAG: PDZ domain-containing protein, partial [Nitrospiraceae bacterium]